MWFQLSEHEPSGFDNTLTLYLQFAKTFLVDYFFEEIQKVKFVVYDVDDRRRVEETQRHDLIGEMECTLADIVTAGQRYQRTLRVKGKSVVQ